MSKLAKNYLYLNALSIDVAVGAVASAIFFSSFFNAKANYVAYVVLGLTVWIIYTADHLSDALKTGQEASTFRHRFHQKNFKVLLLLCVVALIVNIFLVWFLPSKTIWHGVFLIVVVIIYLFTNKKLTYLKEIISAFLYTGGVLIPALSIADVNLSFESIILVFQFFLTALVNLLIFSWYDIYPDKTDNHSSFAIFYGEVRTKNLVLSILFIQLIITALTIYIFSFTTYALCAILMNICFLPLLFFKPHFSQQDRFRILGDAVFFIPLLSLIFKNF